MAQPEVPGPERARDLRRGRLDLLDGFSEFFPQLSKLRFYLIIIILHNGLAFNPALGERARKGEKSQKMIAFEVTELAIRPIHGPVEIGMVHQNLAGHAAMVGQGRHPRSIVSTGDGGFRKGEPRPGTA